MDIEQVNVPWVCCENVQNSLENTHEMVPYFTNFTKLQNSFKHSKRLVNRTPMNRYFLFLPKCYFFDPPENIRKAKVFWCFQGGQKGLLGRNRLND